MIIRYIYSTFTLEFSLSLQLQTIQESVFRLVLNTTIFRKSGPIYITLAMLLGMPLPCGTLSSYIYF